MRFIKKEKEEKRKSRGQMDSGISFKPTGQYRAVQRYGYSGVYRRLLRKIKAKERKKKRRKRKKKEKMLNVDWLCLIFCSNFVLFVFVVGNC